MKLIVNICVAIGMLWVAHWAVQNVFLAPNPTPLGGQVDPSVDAYRGELDTFREAK